MVETTEEFLARFRATGLDMLCDARRRAEQAYPRGWFRGPTRRFSVSWPDYQEIPKNSMFGHLFVDKFLNRTEPKYQFIDMDFSDIERRMMEARPVMAVDPALITRPHREMVVMKGRSVGLSYFRQALAADLMGMRMHDLHIDLEALGHAFGTATQSLSEWVASFGVKPLTVAELRPPERTLWPGVKEQVLGERRVSAKRIAKDRLKKKLAKKSKRKH